MDVVHQVAGFSYAQTDSFRRALKQLEHPADNTLREAFTSGAVERGYPASEANAIYEHIAKFGTAYFTKAHAIAYGMLVYQLGWLKTHYPKQWFLAKTAK